MNPSITSDRSYSATGEATKVSRCTVRDVAISRAIVAITWHEAGEQHMDMGQTATLNYLHSDCSSKMF